MTTDGEAQGSVSQVLGRRARALRTDNQLKIEQVSKAVTARGLRWTPARVSELEAGKVAATITNLTVLSAAFTDLLKTPVRLADWFAGEGTVTLADDLDIPLAALRDFLTGAPVSPPGPTAAEAAEALLGYLGSNPMPAGQQKKLWVIYTGYGETEQRAAESLGIDKATLCGLMLDLWGETLSSRRDRLAPPDANPQKRGRIARQLRQELAEAHHGKR